MFPTLLDCCMSMVVVMSTGSLFKACLSNFRCFT